MPRSPGCVLSNASGWNSTWIISRNSRPNSRRVPSASISEWKRYRRKERSRCENRSRSTTASRVRGKIVLTNEMTRLSTMSPEFRADYMSKPAFRKQYSEAEIRMMSDLQGIVPLGAAQRQSQRFLSRRKSSALPHPAEFKKVKLHSSQPIFSSLCHSRTVSAAPCGTFQSGCNGRPCEGLRPKDL